MGNDALKVTDMDNLKYWIWLQHVIGIGADTYDIISAFGDAKAIFKADTELLRKSGLFNKSQLERKEKISLSVADKAIDDCEKNSWAIITPDSEFYPELLKTTADFPLVLYVSGDKTVLNRRLHIGVIGTRKPSAYGRDVAHTLTKELSKSGTVIVSGGAQGIDSVAHMTAMEDGGKTLLIMGCGLGCEYLMENEEMRRRVCENGALVSEFEPYSPPTRVSFIQRNRITAGICRGVLVVEAGQRSGTLSTARRSFSYNRDVFVVTGDAKGTSFIGAHELVKCGAKVIFSAQDILSLYGYEIKNRDSFYFGSFGKGVVFEGIDDFPDGKKEEKKTGKAKSKKQKSVSLDEAKNNKNPKEEKEYDLSSFSESEIAVFEAVKDGLDRLDDIAAALKIQIRDVLIALTNLEIAGYVECGAGNEYTLI